MIHDVEALYTAMAPDHIITCMTYRVYLPCGQNLILYGEYDESILSYSNTLNNLHNNLNKLNRFLEPVLIIEYRNVANFKWRVKFNFIRYNYHILCILGGDLTPP